MEQLTEYINPELLVLIPVLYLIGIGFKKSERIRDKDIPLLVGVIGVIFAVLYTVATTSTTEPQDIVMMLFSSITQGILCAGASVYVNQLVKQSSKSE